MNYECPFCKKLWGEHCADPIICDCGAIFEVYDFDSSSDLKSVRWVLTAVTKGGRP